MLQWLAAGSSLLLSSSLLFPTSPVPFLHSPLRAVCLSASLARPSHHNTISCDTPHIFSADHYRAGGSGNETLCILQVVYIALQEQEGYEDHMLATVSFVLCTGKWNSASCTRFGRIRWMSHPSWCTSGGNQKQSWEWDFPPGPQTGRGNAASSVQEGLMKR